MIKVYSEEEILHKMNLTGMIPVFSHGDISVCKSVLDICYESGIRVFEFTNRQSNALDIFSELVEYSDQYKDLVLGVGTIFEPSVASKFINARARFIISPALIPELADVAFQNKITWIPGCATVSEVYNATKLGAKLIKAFPGNLLGATFVKAVKSVIPEVKIMPTGGVEPTEKNLKTWFDAGVHCVGMGSQLFKKECLDSHEYQNLKNDIISVLTIINSLRN